MSRTSWLRRPRILGRSAALIAVPALILALPAAAEWYYGVPPNTYPNEAAAVLDDPYNPYDPLPEIEFRHCWWGECRPIERPHRPPPPVVPGILGHGTFLVDCGMGHSEPHRGLFNSVDEAVHFAPPNATVLVLPPGDGTTCVESIHVRRPVTIATYGASSRAVIQAPPGKPCLVAEIPLGDALVIDGIRFIARSHDDPCISVEAGHVVVRNSAVDSRGSNWAFDVRESAELTVESTRIETDASGVHARRAQVALRNLDIDIDGRNGAAFLNLGRTDCTDRSRGTIHGSVGLALECSEGSVDGGSIVGGAVAVIASAGTRGLRITDIKVAKADTGVLLLPGQLGAVNLERPVLSKTHDGIIVAPGAESQITGAVITDSVVAGITVYGAGTLISGNKVVGGDDGIRLFADEAFPPPIFPEFAADPVIGGDDGGPMVENNLIANVRHAAVRIDGRSHGHQARLHGRLIGNTFYARRPAVCIDDEFNDDPVKERANSCNREWLPWPF